ncbi:MAG: hypothetical protein IPJ76_00620 [Flavobacteriales bacterium]|nr:MAG: hypothetical protein IPJ76_00620 [Flavobacteriales bacterium]
MIRSLFSIGLIVTTFLSANNVHSQAFQGGGNVLGLGIGAGGRYSAFSTYSGQSPVFMMTYDHGMGFKAGPGVVGIGGYFAYKTLRYYYSYGYLGSNYYYDERWNYLMFGVRGTYHWNEWHGIDKLDTYAGVLAGLDIISYSDNSYYASGYAQRSYPGSRGRTNLFAGARWYFTDAFGAYAELSHGVSYATIGLQFKF